MPQSHLGGRRKSNKASKSKKTVSSSVSRPESPSMASSLELSSVGPWRRSINHVPKSATTANPSDTSAVKKDLQPNVFEFLDEDDDGSDNSDSEGALPPSAPDVDAARDRHSYLPGDIHLASESSFGTRTPDRTFSVTSKDSVSTDFEPHTPPEGSPATAHLRLAHSHIAGSKTRFDEGYNTRVDYQTDYSAPETFYIPSRVKLSGKNRNSSPSPEESVGTLVATGKHQLQKTTESHDKQTASSFGYAYLASKLDSSMKDGQKLAPVYRRFEAVNHRIILHLQDEISQMEEELRLMDEYDAKHRVAMADHEGSNPVPASRRMDVKAQSYSSFHARRAELLERLGYKVHQYSTYRVWSLLSFGSCSDLLRR